MKLSKYARRKGIHKMTAYRWYKEGKLKGDRTPHGMILVEDEDMAVTATLHERKPVYLPVRLAKHHRLSLDGCRPNSSVMLARRDGWWWLSLSVSKPVPAVRPAEQVVGLDVGIANFLTDCEGHHFGAAGQDFMKQVERVKSKSSRKAKLRACLKKNGVLDFGNYLNNEYFSVRF